MEYLAQILAQISSDSGNFQFVFILTIALAIFIFGLGVMYLVMAATDPLRRRLRAVADGTAQQTAASDSLSSFLRPLEPYILPKKDWERSKVSEKLVHAGIRSHDALTSFYVIKVLLVILLPSIVTAGASFVSTLTTQQVVIGAAIAGLIGLLGPNVVLDKLEAKRMRRIRNGFPDALDLLVVCSEAGLGLNAAIERVSRELMETYPELAEELSLINAEIRVGVDRAEALRNLSRRTGLEDVRGLVALLTQSLRLGTGIAETLRIYSEEFRDKRMQRAEEQAAKIGTKMIFPLVTCLFPGFFVVVVGPAVLKAIEVFGGLK